MVIMRSGMANSVGWVEEVETKGFIFCKLVTSVTTFLTQRRKWLTSRSLKSVTRLAVEFTTFLS